MTNEELLESLAKVVLKEIMQLSLDSIENREQTQPIEWSIAQAVIEALAPMMREVVQSTLTVREWLRHYDLPFDEQPDWHVDKIRFDEALASLPECWKGGV